MAILVIANHDGTTLSASTAKVVSAATQLPGEVTVLLAGSDCKAIAEQAAKITGVSQVLLADNVVYQHQLAENMAELVKSVAVDFEYVLSAANSAGKNLLPRAAALLDENVISDVIKINAPDEFLRPIYAGNALATVKTTQQKKILSIRTTAFSAADEQTQVVAKICKLEQVFENNLSKFVSQQLSEQSRPSLTQARVVISGGRGLQSAENFSLLESLADKLGAAIGASRAAVDAGFIANDSQVGQTGKVVAPDLYIAVGISGAIQHLAGMKDSKVIVAINKDPDAPIFQVADYGLVGDLFEILPELESKL